MKIILCTCVSSTSSEWQETGTTGTRELENDGWRRAECNLISTKKKWSRKEHWIEWRRDECSFDFQVSKSRSLTDRRRRSVPKKEKRSEYEAAHAPITRAILVMHAAARLQPENDDATQFNLNNKKTASNKKSRDEGNQYEKKTLIVFQFKTIIQIPLSNKKRNNFIQKELRRFRKLFPCTQRRLQRNQFYGQATRCIWTSTAESRWSNKDAQFKNRPHESHTTNRPYVMVTELHLINSK